DSGFHDSSIIPAATINSATMAIPSSHAWARLWLRSPFRNADMKLLAVASTENSQSKTAPHNEQPKFLRYISIAAILSPLVPLAALIIQAVRSYGKWRR